MKVIVVEDEMPSARRLANMLSKLNIEVVSILHGIKTTVNWFKNNEEPDLMFLDIRLADGLCFEIFERIEITCKVIFVTAFSEYSIKAFDYNSVSYLLKPVKKEKLEKAIEKVSRIEADNRKVSDLKHALNLYEQENYKTSFVVKFGRKIKIISVEEVICFYSFNNSTYIKALSCFGLIDYSLTLLEAQLNPISFKRVNRSFIINKKNLLEVLPYTNSRLQLKLNSFKEQDIIVSRERVRDFKDWLE